MNRRHDHLRIRRACAVLFLIALPAIPLALVAAEPSSASTSPWEKSRSVEDFRKLLDRSPFSLPTAEASSPLADRFGMTGVASVNGEEEIFVFDRTDQTRSLLTKKPNEKNMSLVSLIRENGSPLKASIRVGGEEGTISFMESTQPKGVQAPAAPLPGSPAAGGQPNQQSGQQAQQAVQLPSLPALPQQPAAAPPTRRIIRRPVMAPPQQSQPPHP